MIQPNATILFHEALEALAQGNLSLAHDKALSAASQYAREGSMASAKTATQIAMHNIYEERPDSIEQHAGEMPGEVTRRKVPQKIYRQFSFSRSVRVKRCT